MTPDKPSYVPPPHLSAAAAAASLEEQSVENLAARIATARAVRDAVARSEQRYQFLGNIGVQLGAAADVGSLARTAVRAPLPTLGDWCFIDLLDERGRVRCTASSHADRTRDLLAAELQGRLCESDIQTPPAHAIRTGQPTIGAIDPAGGWGQHTHPIEERLFRQLGVRCFVIQPLIARNRTFGCMVFLSTVPGRYGAEELSLAGDVARRVALTLDNLTLVEQLAEFAAASERLHDSAERYHSLFEESLDAIYITGRDGRFVDANPSFLELFGYAKSELPTLNARDFYANPEDRERFRQEIESSESVRDFSVELRARDGRSVHCILASVVRRAPDGSVLGYQGIIHDVTKRKRAEDQLVHNAFHDSLTGLANRALFADRLDRLMRHARRNDTYVFGVALLDVDRFKIVNESLGHTLGDELLVAMAHRLESCLRLGDTVARLGGDEFAILLDDVHDPSDATRVAERVLRELNAPFRIGDQEVFVSGSIGIALSSTGYERSDDLLRDADTAMYRAKLAGRGRYELFDRNMHEQAVLALQLETDLRRALDRGELCLHYQPIIELSTSELTGFEALLRWNHPTNGIVAPNDFIPLAEETGLIVPIGWWVLREACSQMMAWQEQFPKRALTVSVNLSGRQFAQVDLVERLDAILAETGFPAALLKLEITESAVMQNPPAVPERLAALRSRGIQLCLDDFGTGYSSLSYLHSLPLDTLKIDKSFISRIGGGAHNFELVQTILALGQSLGMTAVAEGVETAEQLETLRGLRPEHVQGFFFSRPVDAEAATALIAHGVS